VCCVVGVEPVLQPLDHEPLWYATANREDGVRLDVVARDFVHVSDSTLTMGDENRSVQKD